MPTTRKKSNKKWLSNYISISSTKGRLIVFLLVFAVIGGGVMLYSSFAAVEHVDHNYAIDIHKLNSTTQAVEQSDSHGGKPLVWRLERDATVVTTFPVNAQTHDISIKFCVSYRFTVPTTNDRFYMMGLYYPLSGQPVINGSYIYKSVCNPYVPYHFASLGQNYIHSSISNGANSPGDLYVDDLFISWH